MSSRSLTAGARSAVDRPTTSEVWRRGAVAAGVALVANLVLWGIGRGLLGVDDEFVPLETPIPVIITTIVGMLVGTLVFFALVRFTARPVPIFRIVAVAFVLLSLLGPISQGSEPGGDAAAVLTLVAMHVVSATIAIAVLTGVWRPMPGRS